LLYFFFKGGRSCQKNRRAFACFHLLYQGNGLFTNKIHWKKLLPKFAFIIYGLPMRIMQLRESYKMESTVKTANDQVAGKHC
jgi:hypothetical protein